MTAGPRIRDLHAGDMPAARRLLVAADLPVEDLDDESIMLVGAFEGSLVGGFEGSLLGVIGLQRCGGIALLRSLAVAPAQRGNGMARALCERVFDLADNREVWLLTTTAHDYFTKLGFTAVPREQAPAEIRATSQFSSLCPASAHVMRRAPSLPQVSG
jgi:amino-acid N-acetyltransferase